MSETGSPLAHQFDDLDQQHEASILGMWAFLATEVLFFGGLFLAYAIYRDNYPDAFAQASRHLNFWLGFINTTVLLCSSLTMALAVHSAQLSKTARTVQFLIATLVLGTVFLVIKGVEWGEEYHEHRAPGIDFVYTESPPEKSGGDVSPSLSSLNDIPWERKIEIYFILYFTMTGLHAIHMIIGAGIVATIAYKASQGRYNAEHYAPVEITGLYWHFVDIVWVFLFPLLYLINVHK